MSRIQRVVLAILVPVILIGGVLVGRSLSQDSSSGGRLDVSEVTSGGNFDFDFEIPAGTAARITAGQTVEIVPQELTVSVGDSIRIVNDDVRGHQVGVFYVGAGETLAQRFNSPGVLEGACTVHPSGAFVLNVLE